MSLKISLTMKRETWVSVMQKSCSVLSVKAFKNVLYSFSNRFSNEISNFWGGKLSGLTHFCPMLHFYTPRIYQKVLRFFMLSGVTEV